MFSRIRISNVKGDHTGFELRNETLKDYLHGVYTGIVCLRMASTVLATTTYRFITYVMGENIEGVDIFQIDRII